MRFFLSDAVTVLINCHVIPFSAAGLMAAKEIYFFSTALMCFFRFIYFEHLQGSPFIQFKKNVYLSSVLIWIMLILLFINHFNGMLFYVDLEGIYHRDPLFLVQYLLSYIYVFTASIHAMRGIRKAQNGSRRRLMVNLAIFPLAPAAAGILQFLYPEIPLACVALSFETLILYHTWLEEMISIDPLTHLNNRKQLSHTFDQWTQHEEQTPLFLLLIDANKFKRINDTYGHIQGDAALERIAEALRLSCKDLHRRANIARYGGDEFVILVWEDKPDTIEKLTTDIHNNLAELNRKANSPYELTVSIGIAKVSRNKDLKDLITEADHSLYNNKKINRGL